MVDVASECANESIVSEGRLLSQSACFSSLFLSKQFCSREIISVRCIGTCGCVERECVCVCVCVYMSVRERCVIQCDTRWKMGANVSELQRKEVEREKKDLRKA